MVTSGTPRYFRNWVKKQVGLESSILSNVFQPGDNAMTFGYVVLRNQVEENNWIFLTLKLGSQKYDEVWNWSCFMVLYITTSFTGTTRIWANLDSKIQTNKALLLFNCNVWHSSVHWGVRQSLGTEIQMNHP